MTHPAARFAHRHHHPATTATLVLLFWIAGAGLVTGVHVAVEPRSPRAGAVAMIAALMATAWLYTRLVACDAGVTHALGVGIAWLALAIAAEVALATYAGQTWFTLLGSSDRPILRSILLFDWIFSPAVFARREGGS